MCKLELVFKCYCCLLLEGVSSSLRVTITEFLSMIVQVIFSLLVYSKCLWLLIRMTLFYPKRTSTQKAIFKTLKVKTLLRNFVSYISIGLPLGVFVFCHQQLISLRFGEGDQYCPQIWKFSIFFFGVSLRHIIRSIFVNCYVGI